MAGGGVGERKQGVVEQERRLVISWGGRMGKGEWGSQRRETIFVVVDFYFF